MWKIGTDGLRAAPLHLPMLGEDILWRERPDVGLQNCGDLKHGGCAETHPAMDSISAKADE